MKKTLKKILTIMMAVCLTVCLMSVSAFAALDLSATPGEGWTWDEATSTLTLNGATINESITLPAGSKIVVNGNNVIAGGEEDGITCTGSLSISGSGKLTVTGARGVVAPSLTITNTTVDITGTTYGISAYNESGDASVVLTGVSGKIEGLGRAGILTNCAAEGYDSSCVLNGCSLTLMGKQQNNRHSDPQTYSGILAYSNVASVDCKIQVSNSYVNASGYDTGMIVNAHSNSASSTAKANILIENSTVFASTNTNYWAGLFLNNFGLNDAASCDLTVKNSYVSSLAPNDVGIMGTATQGASTMNIIDSVVGVSGKWAGLRIGTSGKEAVTFNNGALVVAGEKASNYTGAVHFMKGGKTVAMTGDSKIITATEGTISFNASEPYYPIAQNSVVTETLTDGTVNTYTFTKQAGGVGGFTYDDDEIWGYDVDFKWESGDIIIYTPEELIEFATYTQDGTLGNCAGRTVKLGANIDMTGYDWYYRNAEGEVVTDHRIPTFSGIFDGQGYSIKNMTYRDEYEEAADAVPLAFILTANGTFKNITIDGITVDTVAPARFGGLADALTYSGNGYTEKCTVKNVVVNADAQLSFGGFAFKILDIAHVTDCHVENFTVNANGPLNGPNSGRCGGFFATGGEVTPFKECSVSDFTVNAKSTGTYLGGFVGGASMTASYEDCYVDGFELNAEDNFSGAVGGFAGYTAGSAWGSGLVFEDCYVKGLDIETSKVISYGAGGFIGMLYGAGKSLDDGAHHFLNCSTEGTISGDAYSGGFVGWLYGRSNGCSAEFVDCSAAVNVIDNQYYAGGFVGNHKPNGSNKMITSFTNCTASGDVFGVESDGLFIDANTANTDGIIGGTYNYDPEDAPNANVAPGYRALDNGDGTWTVFPDNGREVVKVAFHRWNDELGGYENWRTVEVFKDVDFLEADYDNANNYSHPKYRFAKGLNELNEAADDMTELAFTFWTDAPEGTEEVLNEETEVLADMNVYAAYTDEIVDIPDDDPPLTDLPDDLPPKSDVPKTGDVSLLWLGLSVLSGCGAALIGKKRED